MHPAPQSVAHAVLHQAAQAESLADLGSALTRRLHALVPHDGYMLSGNDPVTGAGCFLVERDGYTCSHFRRLRAAGLFDQRSERQRPEPVRRPSARPATAAVVLDSAAAPAQGGGAVLESMAMDGWGSELRFGLADRAARWGSLVLLRERGRPPFTPADIDSVQQVAAPLAAALRAYVARGRPRPLAAAMPPGVLVLDADDTIASATPTARDWLRTCFPSLALDTDEDLALTLWNFTAAARRQGDPVLSRIPTAHGFAELHAQQLTGARGGEVAVTVQAATTGRLLPAVAAWYGLTPRERTVVDQVLEGRSGKQIARTLDLSPHTANDHLKAVYRKIRVNGRDELVATLSG